MGSLRGAAASGAVRGKNVVEHLCRGRHRFAGCSRDRVALAAPGSARRPIIAGGQPAASSDHNLYIALDGAKLVALIVVAWVMVYRIVQSAPIHDRSGKAE
jgi:hypothetical protein